MNQRDHELLFALATIVLGVLAGCIAALYMPPPDSARPAPVSLAFLVALSLMGCKGEYQLLGFRSTSFEMTPQTSNPTPASMGGLYTKSSDGKPRLVDTSSIEYPAGEARHIYTSAGAPGAAVLGDCWIDNTDTNRLWCKEDVGNIRQRFDGTDPGPLGCGGTEDTGCFTSVKIADAPAEAHFSRTCTITSAAAATPVNCLADADVPAALHAHVLGFHGYVDGATAWATTATCTLRDTASIGFITVAVAAMTGNAYIEPTTANVTRADAYRKNLGGTADKGLEIVCNANGTGSDFVVTVFGAIK